MASLGSHANVWSTCLELLHRRGWKLRRILSPDDDGPDAYEATLGDIDLLADNPIELLGLAAIHDEIRPERHTPYWWVVRPPKGEPSVAGRLLDDALAAREARVAELVALRAWNADAWIAELRVVFENSGSASDAAGQLGISTAELRRWLGDPRVAPLYAACGWR
jgi:hypothetical protein